MTLHDGQLFISITIDAMEIKIWNTIIATSKTLAMKVNKENDGKKSGVKKMEVNMKI